MPSTDEALEAIRSERQYQDALWGDEESHGQHAVAEFVLFMEDYLAEARRQLSRNAGKEANELALHTIRKVCALGTIAMERWGAPHRDIKDLKTKHERHRFLKA